jgi:hypothetical protein
VEVKKGLLLKALPGTAWFESAEILMLLESSSGDVMMVDE